MDEISAALEQMALENNPTLRQAMTGVSAAQGRGRQAGTWFNPTIGYSGEEIKPGEIIQLGAYTNFYLAMLNGINPAPIPWVDYFKEQLAKVK